MDNTRYTLETLDDINIHEGLTKEQIGSFENKENALMVHGFLWVHRSENGTPFWDVGSIIIFSLPIILFVWNIIRVFTKNNFFISLLVLFYQLLLIILAPILIIYALWAIGKIQDLLTSKK